MIVLLLFSSWAKVAAAPVGNPLALPSTGSVYVDGIFGISKAAEQDQKCSAGACSAHSQRTEHGVEVGVAILSGLGAYAVAVQGRDTVQEANYVGKHSTYGGGVRLAVSLQRRFWLATTTDLRVGQSSSVQAGRSSDPAHALEKKFGSSFLAVLGHPEDGGQCWVGAQGAWLWHHELYPLGESGVTVDVPLRPTTPFSGVLGGTLISDVVGKPWRAAPRVRVSVEGRLGQETGMQITTGVTL